MPEKAVETLALPDSETLWQHKPPGQNQTERTSRKQIQGCLETMSFSITERANAILSGDCCSLSLIARNHISGMRMEHLRRGCERCWQGMWSTPSDPARKQHKCQRRAVGLLEGSRRWCWNIGVVAVVVAVVEGKTGVEQSEKV